jgi:Zn-dependent protease
MFGRTITLFKLFGFAVRIDTSWVFIAGLIIWSLAVGFFPARYPGLGTQTYWIMGVLGSAGLFLSIIFHELCHSLVARRYGIEMRGITLFIFGGVAEMVDEPPSPRAEFIMAGAGPLSSVALGLAAYAVGTGLGGGWHQSIRGILGYLAGINFLLALFNLVPAFPLDGGRMLRAVIWGRSGNIRRATRVTSNIGAGFGTVLVIIGVVTFFRGEFVAGVWWVLIGLFLRGAAGQAYRQLVLRRALEGEPVRRFMTQDPVSVDTAVYVRDLVDGYFYRTHHKLYPVVDGDRLVGCVTLARVKDVPREKWDWVRVQEIAEACSEGNTISSDADAMDALARMRRHRVSRLLVVDGGRLVGILSLKDLMAFLSMKVELEST